MTIFLVEFDAYNKETSSVETHRYATDHYTTEPNDDPANVEFEERTINPGNYSRSIFTSGRTNGDTEASYGYIELALTDIDPAQSLDYLFPLAVDGRRLVIYSLEAKESAWNTRQVVFLGTMDQIEFSWTRAKIRIRDRLAELDVKLQDTLYAGTTTSGDMTTAEGTPDDLKDQPKPLSFGYNPNVPAILANRFDGVYQLSAAAVTAINAVRDKGVPITFHATYPTLAALIAAVIPEGKYGVSISVSGSYIRLPAQPEGDVTVDVTEGADGQRSAARTARRVLEYVGFVAGVDFVASDFEALHTINPAEVGIWIGTEETTILNVVSLLLDSIGAYIIPDRLGMFRVGRITAPSGEGFMIDRNTILNSQSIQRLATNDEGNGIPSAKVTLEYGQNYLVQPASTLDNATTDAIKAFVSVERRSAVAEDASVRTAHLLASELTFITYLTKQADAEAEATRRQQLYGVRRDRYQVKLKTAIVDILDLGDIVTLTLPRFDLFNGKSFIVIGRNDDLRTGTTVLDLYG